MASKYASLSIFLTACFAVVVVLLLGFIAVRLGTMIKLLREQRR